MTDELTMSDWAHGLGRTSRQGGGLDVFNRLDRSLRRSSECPSSLAPVARLHDHVQMAHDDGVMKTECEHCQASFKMTEISGHLQSCTAKGERDVKKEDDPVDLKATVEVRPLPASYRPS